MDMETLGYFVFMDEQEEEKTIEENESAAVGKDKEELNDFLV